MQEAQIDQTDASFDAKNEQFTWSLDQLFVLTESGGPVAIVLIALSIIVVAVTVLKLWHFFYIQLDARKFIFAALEDWRNNRPSQALSHLENSRNPIAQVMEAAMRIISNKQLDIDTAREEVIRIATKHVDAVRSHLKSIEVIAALSPLLGLLGTVFGMIEAFKQLENAGTAVDPAILSGGIWEALITTAMGLSVAIPAIFVLNWLEQRVSRFQAAMEDAMTQVFIVYALNNASPSIKNRKESIKEIQSPDSQLRNVK